MAEIYTSSASAGGGYLSPDASDHINSVLADLGLGGTAGYGPGAPAPAAEPVEAPAPEPTADEPAAPAGFEDAGAILTGAPASPLAPAAEAALPPAPGADSLPGSHAAGAEAFALGTDTLWGSEGGGGALSAIAPAPAGSDTIRSSGGMETIYGGNATIYASGHSATLHTDTVHAGTDGTTMDGSASTQALHSGGASGFDDLPGGSGSDTVQLHEIGAAGPMGAWDEGQGAAAYDASGDAAHDPTYAAYGSPDSVVAGDGSDPFAGYGYDMGNAIFETGADGAALHDPYLSGGLVTHSDAGTFVSYNDGYDAGYAGADTLPFKDTVMAG